MVFIIKILSSVCKIIFQRIGFLNLGIFPNHKNITILEFTGSADFKHFYHKGSPDPSYSTCKILKVLHPKDWGQELFKPKAFPVNFQTKLDFCRTFSYWDYEQTWFNTFLVQNSYRSHSWLFFSMTMLTSLSSLHGLPDGGIISDLSLTSFLLKFVMVLNSSNHITNLLTLRKKFSSLCLYCTKFFIPWVFQWYLDYSFNNGIIVLQRKFKVKWWNS